MKITKEVAASIINKVRSKVEHEVVDIQTQKLHVYYLDDITLTFTEDNKLYGLMFEALGRDFSIINNLEVLITADNEDGEPEGYIVEDQTLMSILEEYLNWRVTVLDKIGA